MSKSNDTNIRNNSAKNIPLNNEKITTDKLSPIDEKTTNKLDTNNEEIAGKLNSIDIIIKQINSTYGSGTLMLLGKQKMQSSVEAISTGSLLIDNISGIGGIPKGRITEIYGHEGSGKTTIALHIIANAQKNGGLCAFIDVEHALDTQYAEQLGVNVDNILISQPGSGEQALDIVDKLIHTNVFEVIIIDSVAALVPKTELEGEIGDTLVGAQARLMSQALRKMTGVVSKTKTALIFINQIRSKIGGSFSFGPQETTTGGMALKFYSSMRLEIKRRASVKRGEQIIGQEIDVKICKNKLAPPFKSARTEIIYGNGINKLGEIVDLATSYGIFVKSGAWYSYKENKIGQGRDAVMQYLYNNQDIQDIVFNTINDKLSA